MQKIRFFSIGSLNGLTFLMLLIATLCITGCETAAQFQSKHPQDAVVIEDALDFAEKLSEFDAEQVLHLPDGSLRMIFDHQVFVIPAATVVAAQAAGVTVPVSK